MYSIASVILGVINLVNLIVLVWCLLSWFPNIRWHDQPFKTLDNIVRPMVAPFRKLIPPIGGIDLSAMVLLIVLQLVGSVAVSLLRG